MKLVEANGHLLKFRVSLNLWSFGETIEVALGSLDGCTVVDITSTCVLRTQIADWGKNERNVRRLFEEIEKLLGDDCEHERCPLCKECGYLLVGLTANLCPECGRRFSPGEKPARQEMATVRNTLVLAFVITAFEYTLVLFLQLIGLGSFIPGPLHDIRGAVVILFMNLFVLLVLVGMHRVVKHCFPRR